MPITLDKLHVTGPETAHCEKPNKAAQIVKRARRRQQQLLSVLQRKAAENRKAGTSYARWYIAQDCVRIAGAYDAWHRLNRSPEKKKAIPYAEIVKAGRSLDMWNASNEPVYLRPKERLNGRTRYFLMPLLREKARDIIVHQAARVLAELHPNQFKTRGLEALHAWLEEHLPKGAVVITTDIPSCYDTIKRSSVVRDVPLPGHVLKAALFDTKGRAVHLVKEPKGSKTALVPHSGEPTPFVDAGPSGRGMPTGPALADIASEIVIKNVLVAAEHACDGAHAASWGDNLLIIVEDASKAALVYAAVEKAVAENFGMDVLDGLDRRKRVTPAANRFLFCGRWYHMTDGELLPRVERSRLDAAILRIGELICEAKSDDDFKVVRRKISGYAVSCRYDPAALKEFVEEMATFAWSPITEYVEGLKVDMPCG